MLSLTHGQRIDLQPQVHTIRISGQNQAAFAQVAPFLLPLGDGDKLCPNYKPVYPPSDVSQDRRLGVTFRAGEGITVDLTSVPHNVKRLQVVLYVMGGPSRAIGMDHIGQIDTVIDGEYSFSLNLAGRREAALILIEFYRRGNAWRLAATGQGFTTGIPGIMRSYGITLDVPYAAAPPPSNDTHDDYHSGDYHSGDYQTDDQDNPAPPPGSASSGSGFAIAPRILMTNHHVIEHARAIAVTGEGRGPDGAVITPANVIASDPVNDIALLAINHDAVSIAKFNADHDIDLGEDVIVAGFPLQHLLGSGPQISAGNISALTGIRGDASILQFNSPIGSGSSGGPMLDSGGTVIGLVRAVLRNQSGSDSIAQNINFGVKASLLRSFLHASGVTPLLAKNTASSRADIARQARSYLYRINVTY